MINLEFHHNTCKQTVKLWENDESTVGATTTHELKS